MAKMHKYQPVIQLGYLVPAPNRMGSVVMSPDALLRWRESRLKWGSRMEFLLSCIGMAIGIGNMWRFPYMAYKNGGASFVIPYTILLITICVPMYFCEVAIGQFSNRSAIDVWRLCPLGKGIGWGMSLVTLYTCIYYNMLVSYCVYFTIASFLYPIPWTVCNADWNNDFCFQVDDDKNMESYKEMCASYKKNGTNCPLQTSAEQYWLYKVLRASNGIHNLGELRWDLSLCLFLAWLIIWLVIVRGIRVSGKVVFVISIIPYILFIILLIRGLFLKGASNGLNYLFVPAWKKLLTIEVWRSAAVQMFYSTSLSWGVVTMLSSYNEFEYTCFTDSVIVVLLDYGTSMVISITIFSVLGHISKKVDVEIGEIIPEGPGLAFIIFPEAISLMPLVPNVWGVVFFLLVFLLGLDSEFAQLESFIGNIRDVVPCIHRHSFLFTFFLCLLSYLIGLLCCTQAGIYIVSVLDHYTATTNVLLLGFFELAGLMWIYGVAKLSFDFEFMLCRKFGWYWRISWAIICPLVLLILCILAWYDFDSVSYRNYKFPLKADIIGMCLSYSTVLPVPCFAIYTLVKCFLRGNVKQAWQPDAMWGPENPEIHRAWAFQKLHVGDSHISTRTATTEVADVISLPE